MTLEARIAVINARMAMFNCKVEAYKAENARCLATSQSPTYTETSFDRLIEEFSDLEYNAVLTYLSE